jgi:hypothetical protein
VDRLPYATAHRDTDGLSQGLHASHLLKVVLAALENAQALTQQPIGGDERIAPTDRLAELIQNHALAP